MATEHTLAIFIAQLILLLLAGRLLGELMGRVGQPALFGQLLAGVMLGPSVFGVLAPDLHHRVFPDSTALKHMIDAVSQIGIMLLLLLTGMETNLALVGRRKRAVISTSLTGIAVPFACGYALAYALPANIMPTGDSRLVPALFLGTALSISSVKIVAMVLMEIGAIRRDLGQLILATAILDDTIAWIIIAVISGIATHGAVRLDSVAASLAGVAAFLVISLTAGRWLVGRLILWANDHMTIEMPVITVILVVMLTMALVTDLIGVHTALGAFVAGMLVGQSPILSEHIESELRGFIIAFFTPVFFAVAGLGMDLSILHDTTLLMFAGAVLLVGSVGKFAGAMAGGRLGGLTTPESAALAAGLSGHGSTEVIIASIGLAMGALSHELYTMIVAMAVVTTMAMPPTLRWVMDRVPLGPDEAKRLEAEEAGEQENVPKMERALVFVDGSANGRMAQRLARLFTSDQQVLSTVLEHPPDKPVPTTDALDREIAKGYDIAFVGVEQPVADEAYRFEDKLQHLVEKFDGPVAIAANGAASARPNDVPFDILVPVSGTQEGRLATEVAMTLAKANGSAVTALHVFDPQDDTALLRGRGRRPGMSVLVDVHRLGKRRGVPVKGMTATNAKPEAEIRRVVRSGRFGLVVFGTSLRQGEAKFLGSRSASLMREMQSPMLVIAC